MGKRHTSSAKASSKVKPVIAKAAPAKKLTVASKGPSKAKSAVGRAVARSSKVVKAPARGRATPAKPATTKASLAKTALVKAAAGKAKQLKLKSQVITKATAKKAAAPRSQAAKTNARAPAKPAKIRAAAKAPVKEPAPTLVKVKPVKVKSAAKAAAVKTPPVNNAAPFTSLRSNIAASPSVKPAQLSKLPVQGNLRLIQASRPAPAIKSSKTEFDGFKVNDHVVYPAHGVGKIVAVEEQEIAGTRLELFVIAFEHEKMTLRVPLGKARTVGVRMLASREMVRTALKTLRGRARVKRTMWSRRAQEYEAKINSGDLLSIAEVVRDLHRAEGQPEQSYSERQIYESALERLAREVGAVEELNGVEALQRVEVALLKAA